MKIHHLTIELDQDESIATVWILNGQGKIIGSVTPTFLKNLGIELLKGHQLKISLMV